MWVGVERGEGECMNNCPVIGWPDNIGTTQDCLNLEGCDTAGYFSRSCDFAKVDCSSANDDDWATTWKQCNAIEGCIIFNPIFGRNECIPDWNAESLASIATEAEDEPSNRGSLRGIK